MQVLSLRWSKPSEAKLGKFWTRDEIIVSIKGLHA